MLSTFSDELVEQWVGFGVVCFILFYNLILFYFTFERKFLSQTFFIYFFFKKRKSKLFYL